MAESLGAAAPTQLLILMAFPLTGAALLIAYLVFSFNRRAKKAKMKHGSQTDNSETQAMSVADQPDSNQLSLTMPVDDLNANILFDRKHPSASASQPTTSTDSDLNLDILNNGVKMEPTRDETSGNKQIVDLAARLGSQTDPPQKTEPVELLRLLRDPQSGQLIIQVGRQHYTKLADVADKKIGQYILKLAAHFLAFTNGMIVTEAGVKSIYTPKVSKTPQPITPAPSTPPPSISAPAPIEEIKPTQPDPPVPKPSPEIEATFLSSLRATPPQPEPAPSRGLFGRSKPTPAPSILPTLNLAKEINDIVQQRLMYSPLGANNKVDITSAPDGGIRINVNGSFYSSPDDVPDPEIKTLIKESIKQWERS